MKHKINIIFAAFSFNVSEDERTLVLEVSRPPRGTVILLQ